MKKIPQIYVSLSIHKTIFAMNPAPPITKNAYVKMLVSTRRYSRNNKIWDDPHHLYIFFTMMRDIYITENIPRIHTNIDKVFDDIFGCLCHAKYIADSRTRVTDWQYVITQKSFDAFIELLSLPIFVKLKNICRDTLPNLISNLLHRILCYCPYLSYTNAYNVYNTYMNRNYARSLYDYSDTKNDFYDYRLEDGKVCPHLFLNFFHNMKLPLSGIDTLRILSYDRIATIAFKNIKNIFTMTDDALLMIVKKSYKDMIRVYEKKIIGVTTDGFMDALIAYGDLPLLHKYMEGHKITYTTTNLEYACTLMDAALIVDIINNRIVPTKKCIENVVLQFNKMFDDETIVKISHNKKIGDIVGIFISCGMIDVPQNLMRCVLDNSQRLTCSDMRAILKFGGTYDWDFVPDKMWCKIEMVDTYTDA